MFMYIDSHEQDSSATAREIAIKALEEGIIVTKEIIMDTLQPIEENVMWAYSYEYDELATEIIERFECSETEAELAIKWMATFVYYG